VTPGNGPKFEPKIVIWSPGATAPLSKLDVLRILLLLVKGGRIVVPVIVIENPVNRPVLLLPLFSTPRSQLPNEFWPLELPKGSLPWKDPPAAEGQALANLCEALSSNVVLMFCVDPQFRCISLVRVPLADHKKCLGLPIRCIVLEGIR
jgi:hypothetical protein